MIFICHSHTEGVRSAEVGCWRRACAVDHVRTSSSARFFRPFPAFAHVRSLSTAVDGVLRPSTVP